MRLLGFFLLPLYAFASPSFTTHDDVNTIKNSFKVAYAMSDLKKDSYNWEINDQIASINNELENIQSVKQAQKLLKRLFQSTKDYHCSIVFASTETACLPIKVKGVDSRYFITWIDRKKLSTWSFPYKEGDEITHFNNKPMDVVIKELIESDTPNANYATDKLLAENFLTNRIGLLGMEVPQGAVTITVKPKNSSKSAKVNLQWDYHPELIKDVVRGYYPPKATLKPESRWDRLKIMQKELKVPYASYIAGEDKEAFGSKNGFLPKLGKVVYEFSDSFFSAYIFEAPNKARIGYIRIPTFMADEGEVEEFQDIISIMERDTKALVIDQMNNLGGNTFFLYSLLSHLATNPIYMNKHRMAVSQEEVLEAVMTLDELEMIKNDEEAQLVFGEYFHGMKVDYSFVQAFKSYFKSFIDAWEKGDIMTEPKGLFGIDYINPHPNHYSKPILCLINPMDLSCADFFPAILQDNKRATLLGQRTAGAGGAVYSDKFKNRSGILLYSYTVTKAERLNGEPIENRGASPDIEVPFTVEDMQNNYSHFVGEIHKALINLTK